jgi:hypothetical protein
MIQEPLRTYVLELWNALGPAADGFVLVGGQALKFVVPDARATKDFDFVLDVVSVRETAVPVGRVLGGLNYTVVPESRNFQFEKPIPNSPYIMRLELMGPAELKRKSDIRIDVDKGVHARACIGGGIALAESDPHLIAGFLPTGQPARALVRVTRPHALVLLKCLAMDDRYRNLRGIEHYEHDRESARIHVADIVAVLSAQLNAGEFAAQFAAQLERAPELRQRARGITIDCFSRATGIGLLLYEEYLRGTLEFDDADEAAREVQRAYQLLSRLVLP